MIWVWNLLPVIFGCRPPSSPALALTLALTPGGKWCRPTDPTMLILSARHTVLITLLITRHQFDTFSKAHTSTQRGESSPLAKRNIRNITRHPVLCYADTFNKAHHAFTVLIVHWFCANTLLISGPLAKTNIKNITRQPVLTPGGNCPSATYHPDTFDMAPSNVLKQAPNAIKKHPEMWFKSTKWQRKSCKAYISW